MKTPADGGSRGSRKGVGTVRRYDKVNYKARRISTARALFISAVAGCNVLALIDLIVKVMS